MAGAAPLVMPPEAMAPMAGPMAVPVEPPGVSVVAVVGVVLTMTPVAANPPEPVAEVVPLAAGARPAMGVPPAMAVAAARPSEEFRAERAAEVVRAELAAWAVRPRQRAERGVVERGPPPSRHLAEAVPRVRVP
jgi:hypothetical protein